jgi:hypothetical protein
LGNKGNVLANFSQATVACQNSIEHADKMIYRFKFLVIPVGVLLFYNIIEDFFRDQGKSCAMIGCPDKKLFLTCFLLLVLGRTTIGKRWDSSKKLPTF